MADSPKLHAIDHSRDNGFPGGQVHHHLEGIEGRLARRTGIDPPHGAAAVRGSNGIQNCLCQEWRSSDAVDIGPQTEGRQQIGPPEDGEAERCPSRRPAPGGGPDDRRRQERHSDREHGARPQRRSDAQAGESDREQEHGGHQAGDRESRSHESLPARVHVVAVNLKCRGQAVHRPIHRRQAMAPALARNCTLRYSAKLRWKRLSRSLA